MATYLLECEIVGVEFPAGEDKTAKLTVRPSYVLPAICEGKTSEKYFAILQEEGVEAFDAKAESDSVKARELSNQETRTIELNWKIEPSCVLLCQCGTYVILEIKNDVVVGFKTLP